MPYVVMPDIPNLRKMLLKMTEVAKSKRANEIANNVKTELGDLIAYAEDLTKEVNTGGAPVPDTLWPTEDYYNQE